MSFIYAFTDTWTGGTAWTGLQLNVTDVSSTTGSLLFDFQIGGVSKISGDKNGFIIAARGIGTSGGQFVCGAAGLLAASNAKIGFGNGSVAAYNDAPDTYFTRVAAGVVKLNNSSTVTPALGTGSGTFANLPAAATAGAGARAFVTDATATLAAGIGTAVTGGGANKVPVYSDGASWLIG